MSSTSDKGDCERDHGDEYCDCYRYLPLPDDGWTRVFAINPYKHDRDEPVEIEIKLLDLANHDYLNYAAISYAWEGQEPTEVIECGDSTLLVTRTLLTALRNIRKPNIQQHVWADAISINQSKAALEERASQVAMMSRIFSEALFIFVHLGAFTTQELQILPDIKMFADVDFGDLTNFHELTMQQMNVQVSGSTSKYRLPSIDAKAWSRFESFLSRPWFTRLWILQEHAAARNVYFVFNDGVQINQLIMTNGVRRACLYYQVMALPNIDQLISKGFTMAETVGLWIPRISFELGVFLPILRMQRILGHYCFFMKALMNQVDLLDIRRQYRDTHKWVPKLRVSNYTAISHTAVGLYRTYEWPVFPYTHWWIMQQTPVSIEKQSIFYHYAKTSESAVSRSHDRLYSLLGISAERNVPELTVNYRQSVARLAEQITLYFVEHDHVVFILTARSLSAREHQHGWCTDLRDRNPLLNAGLPSVIDPTGCARGGIYQAGGKVPVRAHVLKASTLSHSPQLAIQGVAIGSIAEICPTAIPDIVIKTLEKPNALYYKSWLTALRAQIKWYNDIALWVGEMEKWMSASKHNRDNFTWDCWRTMCGDLTFDPSGNAARINSKPGLVDPARSIMQCAEAYRGGWYNLWKWHNKNVALPWNNLMVSVGYRLATDGQGRPCLVPVGSQVGDILCTFAGFPLPFTLRTHGTKSNLLLGACYVDGMMDGEGYDTLSDDKMETFLLESGVDSGYDLGE